jgi:hypothetical protein
MGNQCDVLELPPGPWKDDIDKYPEPQYEFEHNGIKCRLKRMRGWNWNGYVELPSDHPLYNKSYENLVDEIKVHGDLTYGTGKDGIFGFDTAHLAMGDIVPGFLVDKLTPNFSTTPHFWTFSETKDELKRMAEQFAIKNC